MSTATQHSKRGIHPMKKLLSVLFISMQTITALEASSVDIQTGLSAHWKLDGDGADSSGNNHHATEGGPLTWTEGLIDGAVDVNDTGTLTVATNVEMGTSFTVGAWVYPHSSNMTGRVFVKGDSGESVATNTKEIIIANGQFLFRYEYAGGSNFDLDSGHFLVPNQWVHLAVVRDDASGIAYTYVNGELAQQVSSTPAPSINSASSNIGNWASSDFEGLLDDVRVYSRALSQEDLSFLVSDTASTEFLLTHKLSAHWKLDGASTDSSGNGLHLNQFGNPRWQTGIIGQGVELDGDDYLRTSTDVPMGKSFTIAAWVNPTQSTGQVIIAGKGMDGESLATDLKNIRMMDGEFYLEYEYNGGSNFVGESGFTVPTNNWTHLVATRDHISESARMYANGVLINEFANTAAPTVNTAPFNVGRWDNNEHYFDGQIDEVWIYSRAISEEEVAEIYRTTTPSTATFTLSDGLSAYWQFEGDGADSSGNGHAAAVNGGAIFVPGILGQAVSLDGTDDHLRTTTDVQIGTEFTISAWVQPENFSSLQQIFSKGSTGETLAGNAKQLRLNNGELRLMYEYSSGTDYMLQSPWTAPLNGWSHVTGVRDENGVTYLYANGVLVGREFGTTAPNINSPVSNIGQREGGSEFYNGLIDELRVYSRALAPEEVTQLSAIGKTVTFSPSSPNTNQPAGTVLGILAAEQFGEEITDETFTYAPVSGDGDTDNGLFTIESDGTVKNASNLASTSTDQTYSIRVQTTPTSGNLIEQQISFTLYADQGDQDADGLTYSEELELGTNPFLADTDNDGLNDKNDYDLGNNPLIHDAPYAHWTFDTLDGTTFANSGVGPVSEMKVINPTGSNSAPGEIGNALQLDTSTDYLEDTNWVQPNFSSFTASAWVFTDSPDSELKVMGNMTLPTASGGWAMSIRNSRLLLELVDTTHSYHEQEGGTISANKWVHIAMTWHDNVLSGYINRAKVIEHTISGVEINQDLSPFRMGVAPWDINQHHFTGLIDDARIYSRGLSQTELAEIVGDILDPVLNTTSVLLTNQAAGLSVGTFETNLNGELTTAVSYDLVSGTGDTDNELFSINEDGTLVTSAIIPESAAPVLNFTNAGATGRQGPSQAQIDAEYTGTELEGNVTATATGIQQWTVPATGTYRIETYGAQGAVDDPVDGRGAIMKGDFELEAGETLWILVGQAGQGVYAGYEHLSGGGGTFVAVGADHATSAPLIIAGGGGAHGAQGTATDSGGTITTSGNAGYNGGEIAANNAGGTNGGAGSEGGKGFNDPVSIGMDPAAGWLQGGTTSQTFHQGGLGADADPDLISTRTNNDGGFGGGSALRTSESYATAGGGGGYSGGGSSDSTNGMPFYGGGGGSYNVGLNQDNTPAAHPGHGKVIITQLDGGGDVDLSIRVKATSQGGSVIENQFDLIALFEGGDNDGDLLTNAEELKLGTDPLLADTDGDGLEDGTELELGLNPLLEDRPYAFWPFDTLNDDTFTNYGYAANGDLILSNPTGSNHAAGAINNALQLDGGTDFLGTSVAHPNYDAFSVSLWANTNTPNTDQKIIGNMQSPAGGWSFGITSSNLLYLEFNDAGSTYHNETYGNIPSNEWVHLAMVWNAGNSLTGYINGVEVINRDLTGVAMGTNHYPIRVGAAAWDHVQFHYSGLLDDIRIYDRALTTAEIEGLSLLQQPPEAETNTYFTAANVPLTVTLAATDVNGDPITYDVTDTPDVGTLTANTQTSYTYLAPEGFEGTETLTFTASDQTGSTSATITINVVVPPVAVSSEETILQNQTAQIPLNIINPDGEPLYIKILQIPENGTLYQTPDGQTRGTEITQDNTVLDSSAGQVIFVPGVEEFGENYATIRYQILPGVDPLAEIPEEAKTTDPDFPTGRGTVEEPYQIGSLSQLISFQLSGSKSKHYELTANIDASAYTWNSIPEFSGTLDGKGFSIYNLTITDGSFITSLEGTSSAEHAVIRNLGLVDVHVSSETGAAPLVMAMRGNSEVTNCFVTGNVQGQNSPTSGLIGFSYAESGQDLPLLQNSWSAANVVNTSSLDNNGGIAGEWEFGLLTNCYFGGSIEASSSNTGGLVGTSAAGTITNSYSFGKVLLNGGGLIGAGGTNTSNSFWDTTASGKDSSAAGTGLPTPDIQDSTTYTNAGWEVGADTDGDGVFWSFDPKLNCGYPFLSHQTIHHVCAEASVIIHVIVVNDPPTFTSTPPATATEEQDFLYNLAAEDPEGDDVTFSGVSLPGWLSVDNFEGAVLYGTPQNADIGTHTITLEVTDTEGNSSQQIFDLLVIDVNDLPVTTDATETVEEDVPTLITLLGSDPDEDPLTFVITELPANGTLYQTVEGELLGAAITQPNTLLTNTDGDLYFVTDSDENGQNYTTFKFQVMDGAAKVETNDTASTVATQPSGDGTATNPYQISILGHLSWLVQNNDKWAAHYIQTANIDAAATKYWDDSDDNEDGDKYNDPADTTAEGQNEGFLPIGSQYTVIFTGDYDGRGYSILDLTINRGDRANIGLFGKVENAHIRSVGLVDVNITGNANVGALVGILQDSTVENSFSTGIITGELSGAYSENIGGLVGQMIGNSSSAVIVYSWSGAHVHNPVSNGGGLVGVAKEDSLISHSFANGSVSGDGSTNGGLVGNFSGTEVDQTYSLTDLSAAGGETGGLFGAVTVTPGNSFWDTELSSLSTSPAGAGKTSAELQTQATFTGWDFTDGNDGLPYWQISSIANDSFPYLNWQKVVSLSNESTVTIHATAVSDPPSISAPSTASMEEDSSTTISVSASDPEEDAISFDVSSGEPNVSVSVTGSAPSIDIVLTPNPNWFGTAEIFVTADDDGGGSSTEIILITVTPVNDLPEPTKEHKTTDEDTPVAITLQATDVESEPITYIIKDLPANGTLYQTDNGTHIVSAITESGTIVSNSQGIVIYVPDEEGYGEDYDAFTFAVTDPNEEPDLSAGPEALTVIHQPAMTNPYGAAYYGGKGYITALGENKVYEIDPESGATQVAIDGAVIGKTINQIAISASGDLYLFYSGANETIHKFSHPYDHTSPIVVGQKSGNTIEHAVIDHSGTQLYMVDSSDTIQRIKTDATEPISTPWATITGVTLRSIAMDSHGNLFASKLLGEIYKIPVIEGGAGNPAVFATANTYGISMDGDDNLWVTTHSQADILKINPAGEITTFSPQGISTPHYIAVNEDASLIFEADWDIGKGVVLSRTGGGLVLNSAEITLDVLPVNDVPVIDVIADQTTAEDTPLTINLSGMDPDPDNLTFSATGSANVSATVTAGTLTLTPSANWHGDESITVTINDGNGGSDVTAFHFTVTPVDDAPTIGGVSTITGEEDVPFPISKQGNVTTIAGNGTAGFADGTGTNAQFNHPTGIVVDSHGNLFISDYQNHKIRTITPDGTVSTFAGDTAGTVEGNGTAARFHTPSAITIGSDDVIYLTEGIGNVIRKITPNGDATILAGLAGGGSTLDGSSTDARFNGPNGIALDEANNILYVSEYNSHVIRKIDLNLSGTDTGFVTTLAGAVGNNDYLDGTGTEARFRHPWGLDVDSSGNIYVAEYGNLRIRKITPQGVVTTIAGSGGNGFLDGVGTSAMFSNPWHAYVFDDNTLFVGENTHRIRKIDLANNNTVTTLIGNGSINSVDGLFSQATAGMPSSLFEHGGALYFTSYANHNVRKIEFGSELIVTEVDGDTVTVNLAVNTGILSLALQGSTVITAGTNETANLSIQGSVEEVNATLNTLHYIGPQDFLGQDTLTFSVSDGTTTTENATATIIVENVPDVPVLDEIGYQESEEDSSMMLTLTAFDADEDDLTFTVTVIDGDVTATLSGAQLTITPETDWNGSGAVTVTVDDGNGGTDSETFEFFVIPVNDVPSSANGTITVTEDTAYSFSGEDFTYSDDDGDAFYKLRLQSATKGTLWVDADGNSIPNEAPVTDNSEVLFSNLQQLKFLPATNAFGNDYATFSFEVSDGQDYSSSHLMTIHVTPVEENPVAYTVNSISKLNIPQSVILSGSDPEDTTLSFTITSLPTHGQLYQTVDGIGTATQIAAAETNVDRLVPAPGIGVLSVSPPINGSDTIDLSESNFSGFEPGVEYTIISTNGNVTVDIQMWGAGGGNGSYNNGADGGGGGMTSGKVVLEWNTPYKLIVGQGGKGTSSGSGGTGGFPGGGYGTLGDASGAGGGGYTGFFLNSIQHANSILIAGGGGGATDYSGGGNAGAGGGLTGQTASGGAQGGSQTAGGNATSGGAPGSELQGGTGDHRGALTSSSYDGGGGGGGYYGGEGGYSDARPGAGGSGFVHPILVTEGATHTGNFSLPAQSSSLPTADYAFGGVNSREDGKPGFVSIGFVEGTTAQGANIIYVPDQDYIGEDSFSYVVTDAANLTAESTVITETFEPQVAFSELDSATFSGGSASWLQINPLPIQEDFTIQFWMKTTDPGGTNDPAAPSWSNGHGLVDADMPGNQNDFGISLLDRGIAFGVGNPEAEEANVYSTSKVDHDEWFHVAATRNAATGEIKLYIDGALEDHAIGTMEPLQASTRLVIGQLQTLTGAYTGEIADLRIHNTVRSETQIIEDANNISDTSEPGLIGHYTFAEFGEGIAGGGQQPWDMRNRYFATAFGQDTAITEIPTDIIHEDLRQVAVGRDYALALTSGGTVLGWGDNTEGQINIPAEATYAVRQVAASHQVAYALKNDGTVIAWGKDDGNRLDTTGLTNIVKIADQNLTALFLEENGKVHIRSTGDLSISDVSSWASGVQDIASSPLANLAVIDGEAVVIGSTNHGLNAVPEEAKSDVISVHSQENTLFVQKMDGTIIAWGNNSTNLTSQLGTLVPGTSQVRFDGGVDPDHQLVLSTGGNAISIDPGLATEEYNQSVYFITPTLMTWHDAEAWAVSQGGHLASVDDAEEQAFLAQTFNFNSFWIGLYRVENSWDSAAWSNGSTSTYRNWSGGEPNGPGPGGEPATQMHSNGTWNDLNDQASLFGIVEISNIRKLHISTFLSGEGPEAGLLDSEGKLYIWGSAEGGVGELPPSVQAKVKQAEKGPSFVVALVADNDGDHLPDIFETETGTFVSSTDTGTSPSNPDEDQDGVLDGEEVNIHESNPFAVDTDSDGLEDALEITLQSNLISADTDSDTFTDAHEHETGTDLLDPNEFPEAIGVSPLNIHADTTNDSDGDGLTDGEETHIFDTNPEHPDVDEDGLTDAEEIMLGTNPYAADSDQDTFTDGYEYATGTDPLDPEEVPEASNQSPVNVYADSTNDSDSDGLTDGEEVHIFSTNPNEADSDEDGLSDSLELDLGTDPNHPDSDDDTFTDAHEFTTGTNPLDPGEYPESENESPLALFADTTNDTDEDGLTDGEETHIYNTNPDLADTDSDGLSDPEELALGTNPGDADSDQDGSSDADELEFDTDPLDPESFLVSISGAITYQGLFTGPIYLVIERDPDSEPITESFEEPGNFLISNLQNHYQYKIWAFMDLNSDKDYQQDEPFGALHAEFTTLTEDLVEQVIHMRDTNAPPEGILLSNMTVEENAPSATLVGTLTAVDPDEDDSFTFSLVNGSEGEEDNHYFTIDGNSLYTTEPLNYEETPVLDIVVQVQDSYGETVTASFTIDVTNLFTAILSTNSIEEGDSSSLIASGSILGDGGAAILHKGILYGRSPGLGVESDNVISVSSEDSSESEILVTLSGLTPNRKYYFRTFAENSEGMAYGPERSFITPEEEISTLWANAIELTGGWYSMEGFGNFYLQESPWIYHEALGWLYAVEDETDGVWLWNSQLGWCWTKFDFFPYLWKDNTSSWIYYLLTDETDRVFYNSTENLLETYPLQ